MPRTNPDAASENPLRSKVRSGSWELLRRDSLTLPLEQRLEVGVRYKPAAPSPLSTGLLDRLEQRTLAGGAAGAVVAGDLRLAG